MTGTARKAAALASSVERKSGKCALLSKEEEIELCAAYRVSAL
jgi:hypothetical protein